MLAVMGSLVSWAHSLLPALLALVAAGCTVTPPARVETVDAHSDGTREGTVYLIRGLRGLLSHGVDQLAQDLRARGIETHVFAAEQVRHLERQMRMAYREAPEAGPIIIIGYSQGANAAVHLARGLDAEGIPVELLVTLDGNWPPPVTPNVRACYNYYPASGLWRAVSWMFGAALVAQEPGEPHIHNIDVVRNFAHGPGHLGLATHPDIRRNILRLVIGSCPQVDDPNSGP